MPEKPLAAATFGALLRQHRRGLGLTQAELAEAAEIHWKYVSMLERGLRQPTLDVLLRLASALGISASELVAEVERALAERV